MKKIISLCLSLCVIMSCFTIASVNAAALKKADIAKEGGLLQAIGIIDSIADDTEGNHEITRAEFAVTVGKAIGIKDAEESVRYFTDIPMSHWAVSYVNRLAEMNIISFSDDKLFRPNDKITVNEAVKILVSALGYGEFAYNTGGYPKGYTDIAQRLGFKISSGISDLTVYQSYILLYDALRSGVYEMYSADGHYITFEESDETLLSKYFDIYEAEGIVTQCSGISIYGAAKEGKTDDETAKIVKIDDNEYISDINFYNYLGRRTHVYYIQKDKRSDDDTKTIVYREDYKRADDVSDIAADDILSFEDSVLCYEDGTKEKRVKIPVGAIVVKNGSIVRENTVEAINIKKGSIRVIDIEDDGTVDVVLIWEYRNIVADIINAEDFEVYDKVKAENKVNLDSEKRIIYIEDINGNKKSFSDIKANTIVSVYESDNYVKAVINSDPVTAILYRQYEDEGKQYMELGKSESDRTSYEIDIDFYNNYLQGRYYKDTSGNMVYTGDIDLRPGVSITYYKDAAGNIAYLTGPVSEEWTFGYLIRLIDNTDDDNTMIKVYTQNDVVKTYTCAEKVSVDGVNKKKFNEIYEALTKDEITAVGEHEVNGQIIRFRLNSDGVVKGIDSQKFNREREGRLSIHHTGSEKNVSYWYHPACFPGGKHFYDKTTLKFIVPLPADLAGSSDDDFSMLSNFEDNVTYTFDCYRLDEKGANENVFVIYGADSTATTKGPYLVGNVVEEIGNDDVAVAKAELYSIESTDMISVTAAEGYLFEFEAKDANGNTAQYTMGKGDIVFVKIDSKGKAIGVVVYNDYSRMNEEGYNAVTGWKNVTSPRQTDQHTDLLCSPLKAIDDGIYRFTYGAPLTAFDLDDNNYSSHTWATRSDIASVLVYDGRNVSKSTAAELIPATVTGANNAKNYWFAVRYARLKGAVVYK